MTLLPVLQPVSELPPILAGAATPQIQERVERFYLSIPEIFEAWVKRCESPHTQRAYRADVTAFIAFFGVVWPKDAWRLFAVTVPDVQEWRDAMIEAGLAPKTRNRRLSSLSHFFRYLAEAAKELRLPVNIPNPAHAQFVPRKTADARDETRALTITRARQLLSMPDGETLLGLRDRALLAFYLYTGARIATGCRVQVADFHHDEDGATVTLHHKGDHRVVIGLHWQEAETIRVYVGKAEIGSGPLFRPRKNSRSKKLADHGFHPATRYLLLQSYLSQLPGAVQEEKLPDGTAKQVCIYTPHSLRATAATLLLGAGVDIRKVQELLGHRHVTTTQIYDKRRLKTSEGASHDIAI